MRKVTNREFRFAVGLVASLASRKSMQLSDSPDGICCNCCTRFHLSEFHLVDKISNGRQSFCGIVSRLIDERVAQWDAQWAELGMVKTAGKFIHGKKLQLLHIKIFALRIFWFWNFKVWNCFWFWVWEVWNVFAVHGRNIWSSWFTNQLDFTSPG